MEGMMDFLKGFSDYEIGDLSSALSRLLTACLGAAATKRCIDWGEHEGFLLDSGIAFMTNVLAGLNFMENRKVTVPGAARINAFNLVVKAVLNRRAAPGEELCTVEELEMYFEQLRSCLATIRKSGLQIVNPTQIEAARRFFFDLASYIPDEEDSDDGSRLTIMVQEAMLRELKRVAQKEGTPIHQLVGDLVLGYLERSRRAHA